MEFENFTIEDATRIASELTKDVGYYESGVELLKQLKAIAFEKPESERKSLFVSVGLYANTTEVELDEKIENTLALVESIKRFIQDTEKCLITQNEDSTENPNNTIEDDSSNED